MYVYIYILYVYIYILYYIHIYMLPHGIYPLNSSIIVPSRRGAEFAAAVGRAHRGQAADGRDAEQRTHGAHRLRRTMVLTWEEWWFMVES